MAYKIPTTVKNLENKKLVTLSYIHPVTQKLSCVRRDMGWFVHFEGSYESLFVGFDRPLDLEPGTDVEIIIQPKSRKCT